MSEPTQAPTPASAPVPDDPAKRMREKLDKLLTRDPCRSEGSIVLNGRTLKYHAIAAFVPVVAGGVDDKRGDPEAAIFTTSYLLDAADPATRPVCFAFNGGPGSASIWLHLGALGPKRVVIRDDGTMPPPPYTVTDNPRVWFEHFDLVFIDPPHTGYSITASEDARKKMLSVDGDVDALAEVHPRAGSARHRRWGSPVYLAGESYGTTRGAALADKLQDAGRRAVRADPRVVRDGPAEHRVRAAQRPAVRAVPARLRQRRAVPRQAEGRARRVAGRRRARRAEAFVAEDYLARAARRRAAVDGTRGGASSSRIARADRPARRRWSRRRTCASATRRSSSSCCATAAGSSAGSRRASPGRWPRAARATGSSTPASRRSPRRTRWPRTPT